MKAVRFPTTCPICGVSIADPRDALANHGDCHRVAYRLAEHANAMKMMAKHWPARDVEIIAEPDTDARRPING